jgi:thioredoxin-related protein
MNAVQLDMWSNTPVRIPDGKTMTARKWARKLNIFYAPTLVFFDSNGKEIIRVDSVVQFYRLWGVLDYINRRGYEVEPNYQEWRLKQRKIK